jgi:hypothetical protein
MDCGIQGIFGATDTNLILQYEPSVAGRMIAPASTFRSVSSKDRVYGLYTNSAVAQWDGAAWRNLPLANLTFIAGASGESLIGINMQQKISVVLNGVSYTIDHPSNFTHVTFRNWSYILARSSDQNIFILSLSSNVFNQPLLLPGS